MRGAGTIVVSLCLLGAATPVAAQTGADSEWLHLGPLRIRDLTPFGIQRLDFLPAHALQQQDHTWTVEVNLSYQNTFVLSDNVAEYLKAKSLDGGRVSFTPDDAAILFAGDEDAYLLDGELGLYDLTGTYRFDRHWSAYATLPVFSFGDGIFDEFIESFHERFGFDTANRELVVQDDLSVMSRLGDRRLAVFEPPDDGIGDPVFGGRYALFDEPSKWNLIGEAAIKVAFRDTDFFHSSGRSDYGVQVSLERFFRRQAFYLTFSEVYFSGFGPRTLNPPPVVRHWISTLILAYERRFMGPVNGIFQLYRSPSTVGGTSIEGVKQTKYQLSGGLQWQRKGWVYRLGVTENLRNFENTPDVGATISVARIVLGRESSPRASASR
jgi:hypothetical protein